MAEQLLKCVNKLLDCWLTCFQVEAEVELVEDCTLAATEDTSGRKNKNLIFWKNET